MEKVSKVFSFFGFLVSVASIFMPLALLGFSAYSNASLGLGLTMSVLYFAVPVIAILFAILSKKFATKIKAYHFKRFVMLISSVALLADSFLAEVSIFSTYTNFAQMIIYYISAAISVLLVAVCIAFYVVAGNNNRAPKGTHKKKKYKKKSKKKIKPEPAYERDLIYR